MDTSDTWRIFAGLGSGEMQSRAIRSDEARAKRHKKRNQRHQAARKAGAICSQNVTETGSAQEAEGTDCKGKWMMSSEYFHGPN